MCSGVDINRDATADGTVFLSRDGAILRVAIFGNDYVKGLHSSDKVKIWKNALYEHDSDLNAIAKLYGEKYPVFWSSTNCSSSCTATLLCLRLQSPKGSLHLRLPAK